MLTQALKAMEKEKLSLTMCEALVYLHAQNVAHGHLCPESFLVDDGGKLEKRLRLVWTPGQRRIEGPGALVLSHFRGGSTRSRRAPATLGFKGSGAWSVSKSQKQVLGRMALLAISGPSPAFCWRDEEIRPSSWLAGLVFQLQPSVRASFPFLIVPRGLILGFNLPSASN